MTAAAAAVERFLKRLTAPRRPSVPAEPRAPPARALAIVAGKTADERHYVNQRNAIARAEKSALLDAIADDLADAIWADFTGSN